MFCPITKEYCREDCIMRLGPDEDCEIELALSIANQILLTIGKAIKKYGYKIQIQASDAKGKRISSLDSLLENLLKDKEE